MLTAHTNFKMKPPIFVYGTLCSPQVLQVLLDRSLPPLSPARLIGHARYPVRNCLYPGTVPTPQHPQNYVDGYLLQGLTSQEHKLLDWFEGDEYERVVVPVLVHDHPDQELDELSSTIPAEVYIWKNQLLDKLVLDQPWCLETFQNEHLELYIQTTVLPCRLEMEQLGMTQKQE